VTATPAPRVVVTVGTDHHPFERLLGWLERAVAAGVVAGDDVLVQHGATRPPVGMQTRDRMPRAELVAAMGAADVVVGQGGPGTILDARGACRVPLVVPRLGSLGEAVDDHQRAFVAHLAAADLIVLAEDEATFVDRLGALLADPSQVHLAAPSGLGSDPAAVAARFGDLVAGLPGQPRPRVLRRIGQLVRPTRQPSPQPNSRPR
jgi:UDP-N-acetylglucosamine transferase subunit ALG13